MPPYDKKKLLQALLNSEPKPIGLTVGELQAAMKSMQKGVISVEEAMAAFGGALEPTPLPPYIDADVKLSQAFIEANPSMHISATGWVGPPKGKKTLDEAVKDELDVKQQKVGKGLLALEDANFKERAKQRKAEREQQEKAQQQKAWLEEQKKWAEAHPWLTEVEQYPAKLKYEEHWK